MGGRGPQRPFYPSAIWPLVEDLRPRRRQKQPGQGGLSRGGHPRGASPWGVPAKRLPSPADASSGCTAGTGTLRATGGRGEAGQPNRASSARLLSLSLSPTPIPTTLSLTCRPGARPALARSAPPRCRCAGSVPPAPRPTAAAVARGPEALKPPQQRQRPRLLRDPWPLSLRRSARPGPARPPSTLGHRPEGPAPAAMTGSRGPSERGGVGGSAAARGGRLPDHVTSGGRGAAVAMAAEAAGASVRAVRGL